MATVTIDATQCLYVTTTDGGAVSCLGWRNAADRTTAIANELSRPDLLPTAEALGTLEGWEQYIRALHVAEYCGRSLACNLTPQLIGLERRRVEVRSHSGETRRFWVGKSMGWIPCHIEVHNRRSLGGPPAECSYLSVRVVR